METIEERAKEYAKIGTTLFMESPEEDGIYWDDLARAYTAGAKSEHDMLTAHYEAEVAKYKRDLDESREREKIACKAVAEKREEIARLTKWNEVETDKDGLATFKALDAIFDRLPCLIKDNQSGEIELIDYDNASEWRGDIERKPSCYRWREIHE